MLLQIRIFNRLVSSPTFLFESSGGCVVLLVLTDASPVVPVVVGPRDKGSKATEVPTTSRTVLASTA
jgi:hypothetical protein